MRCRDCTPVPEEVRRAAGLLERRWAVSIVYAAHGGAVRFTEFRRAIGAVSPRTLADRLRELEQAGLFERRVIASRPPLVEYRLTERGAALAPVVEALARVAAAAEQPPARAEGEAGRDVAAAPRHAGQAG